ncbi:pyridoxamine 5'-phosphate oxidase family protein [Mesobacillus zeae]|uniref:pyridoxamine 5'-phosphate oxidase family protein n=1 Tax=Mesobacillus zeae TaxID=1917180 RepID=UPI00300B6B3C
MNDSLKQKVLSVLEGNRVGSLATIKNNKPHSRYMTFLNEGLTLYTPTTKDTYKTEEIETNPNVHILLGYFGEGMGDAFVEIQGTAEIKEDKDLKSRIWNEHMEKWIKSPDDPDYIVLKIQAETIRLMNDQDAPKTLNLKEME